MTTSSISNGQVELSSALPGLIIDNEFGRETVMIALVLLQIQLVEQIKQVTLVLKLEQQIMLEQNQEVVRI